MAAYTNYRKLIGLFGLLLFILAFSAIFYLGYKEYFSSRPLTATVTTSALNKKLPIADSQKSMNKLELYLAAEKDSLRKKELLAADPYTNGVEKAPVQPDFSTKNFTLKKYKPKDETDIQLRLNKIYQRMAERPVKKEEPVFSKSPFDTGKPVAVDPQMKQLETMLDKLIDIQHPEMVKQRIKRDTVNYSSNILNNRNTSFQAVVHQKQVITTNGTIKLRLLQDLTLKDITIPKGNFLFGTCEINNERVTVNLSHATYLNQVYPVSLKVFDIDGIEGIRIRRDVTGEVTKESADQAIQSFNLGGYETSIGGQAASAGIQTAKSLLSKKVKIVSVTVKADHHLILQSTQYNF